MHICSLWNLYYLINTKVFVISFISLKEVISDDPPSYCEFRIYDHVFLMLCGTFVITVWEGLLRNYSVEKKSRRYSQQLIILRRTCSNNILCAIFFMLHTLIYVILVT